MGLDITHCNFSVSYSYFHDYRKYIASMIGIDLDKMVGFGSGYGDDRIDGTIEWTNYPDEPLCYFLNHSDCDGEIDLKNLSSLKERLGDIIVGMEKHIPNVPKTYIKLTKELIKGCEHAIELNENIRFL